MNKRLSNGIQLKAASDLFHIKCTAKLPCHYILSGRIWQHIQNDTHHYTTNTNGFDSLVCVCVCWIAFFHHQFMRISVARITWI